MATLSLNMEKVKYCQICLYRMENPIIAENQSIDENTANIKIAISEIKRGHLAMLEGELYDKYSIDKFIEKVTQLCDCNKEELMEYFVNIK